MDKKETLLFYCHNRIRIHEVIILTKELNKYYNVCILINKEKSISELLTSENLCFIEIDVNSRFVSTLINNPIIKKIKKKSLGMYLHELIFTYKFYQEKKYFKSLIGNLNFSLFLTLSDRHLSTIEYALSKVVKELNKKILIPYTVFACPDGYISGIKNNKNYMLTSDSSFYQKYIFNKYKKYQYKGYYTYPAFLYEVLSKNKVLSKNPWVLGAGLADKTIVANLQILNDYKKRSPDGCYRIVSDISYLSIIKSLEKKSFKKEFIMKNKLDKDKKIVIFAPGPWNELNYFTKEEYLLYLEDYIKNINSFSEFNLVLSLHPSMDFDNYKYLIEKFDICIPNDSLSSYISVADIYITYLSSTIFWSTILGIKTIVLNEIIGKNMFNFLNSPIVLNSKENFSLEFRKLIETDKIDYSHDWNLLSKNISFNNNMIELYKKEIDELISQEIK